MSAENRSGGFAKAQIEMFPLYFVYIFLSGWTFLDKYYRYFGIDLKSLGIGVPDVLVKGFTILIPGPNLLWLIYLGVFISAFVADWAGLRRKKTECIKIIWLIVLIGLLIPTYKVASKAGLRRAQEDKGEHSQLPSLTFLLKNDRGVGYHGKLLFRSGDIYFIHGVAPIGQNGGELELSVYKGDEIRDVKITEHN